MATNAQSLPLSSSAGVSSFSAAKNDVVEDKNAPYDGSKKAAIMLPVTVAPEFSSVTAEQPFRQVLSKIETVSLEDDNLIQSLENVQKLRASLGQIYSSMIHARSSPGFKSRDDSLSLSPFQEWKASCNQSCYETYNFSAISTMAAGIPLPSISFVIQCLELFEVTLGERLKLVSCGDNGTAFCDCIKKWHPERNDVLYVLLNQTLEQFMIEEATRCLNNRYLGNECDWTESYHHDNGLEPPPAVQYVPNERLKVMKGRDECLRSMSKYALVGQTKIQIMTCYLWANDPCVRYFLLDFLPHVLQKNSNLEIQVLIDLMTIESAMVKSLFHAGPPSSRKGSGKLAEKPSPASKSFIKSLPDNAPKPSDWSQDELHGLTPFDFLQLVMETATRCGSNYQIKFWCARDSIDQYRIKNHAKCFVVDGQVAILGGSNFFPTVSSALNELDVLVAGVTAQEIGKTFDLLWKSMGYGLEEAVEEEKKFNDFDIPLSDRLQNELNDEEWTSASSKVAFIRSEPSSLGEDLILRHVLHRMSLAEKSIFLCMGHANVPDMVTRVLKIKCRERKDLKINLLFNSWHTSDLRTGQQDLLVSVKRLLKDAPSIHVYITKAGPFLHSKYVVVDSEWSAIGSWNMWTRCAFHEIEHEAFVQDKALAVKLEEKFHLEKCANTVRLKSVADCSEFCPSGCYLCRGFGPFLRP
mmetsp:Transcript_28909/g.43657  ORF Transcript_28909/g.43657 Transcript_28909/m.43657 type:complete len:695 (-) Transcript_28909:118-2202(-)